MKDQASNLRKLVMSKLKEEEFRVISLVSMVEGVGKSRLVVDMATRLSNMGQEVLIVRLTNEEGDKLSEDIEMANELYSQGFNKNEIILNEDNIHIIDVNIDYNIIKNLEEEQRDKLLNSLDFFEDYNYVLIDTISGAKKATIDMLKVSNNPIYVHSAKESDIIEAYKFMKIVCQSGHESNLGFIINKVRNQDECEETCKNLSNTVDHFLCLGIDRLGNLRHNDILEERANYSSSYSDKYPDAQFSKDLEIVLKNIMELGKLNIYNAEILKEKLIEVYETDKNL